jgi:hypothetical protein
MHISYKYMYIQKSIYGIRFPAQSIYLQHPEGIDVEGKRLDPI